MSIERAAAFAGRFYPGEASACRAAVEQMIPKKPADAAVGAIVPHAGWVYSGSVASVIVGGDRGGASGYGGDFRGYAPARS